MTILQINYCTVYLEKYSKTLSLLFCFFVFCFKFQEFFDRTPLFILAKYWHSQNLGEIAVQSQEQKTYGDVADNKCIQKCSALVFLYNENKIWDKLSESKVASQSFPKFKQLSKSKINIPLYKHNRKPFQQNLSFSTRLSNNIFNFLQIKCLAQRLCSFKRKLYRRNMLLLL